MIQFRTTYELDDENSAIPVCTVMDSKNGAAFYEIEGTLIRIQVPYSVQIPFFGPILIPIFPNLFSKESFKSNIIPSISIEVIPKEGKTVNVKALEQILFFDDKKIKLDQFDYKRKIIDKDEFVSDSGMIGDKNGDFSSDLPFRITFLGDAISLVPKEIKVTLNIKIADILYKKELNFKKNSDWEYFPIWGITTYPIKKCKRKLPNGKMHLF